MPTKLPTQHAPHHNLHHNLHQSLPRPTASLHYSQQQAPAEAARPSMHRSPCAPVCYSCSGPRDPLAPTRQFDFGISDCGRLPFAFGRCGGGGHPLLGRRRRVVVRVREREVHAGRLLLLLLRGALLLVRDLDLVWRGGGGKEVELKGVRVLGLHVSAGSYHTEIEPHKVKFQQKVNLNMLFESVRT